MQLNLDPLNIDIKQDIKQITEFDDEGICHYLQDAFTFNRGILIGDNNKIIGAGVLRAINEFKMVLDPSLSRYARAKALKLMMDIAIKKAQSNEIIVNVTKDQLEFSSILYKHYQFQLGSGLIMRLEK